MASDAARTSLPEVDLASRGFWEDPASALGEARRRSPLARTPGGQLLVLRYRDNEALLGDPELVTVGRHLLEGIGIRDGPLAAWWKLVMFNTNPPEHTRLRSLVSRAFTARRVDALRPAIRALADELCDDLAAHGEADFVTAFAHHLPIRAICTLLGLPRAEHDAISQWTCAIGSVFATRMDSEKQRSIEASLAALDARLREHIEVRRRAPGDDLLSALVAAEDAGDRLSSEELVAMTVNLLFAGHDTTRGLLSIGLATLLHHPEAMGDLRSDPSGMPGAVDEMLRFEAPTLGSLRAAPEDMEIAGCPVAAGEPINLLAASANRDEEIFPDADRFDIHRRGARHLSFGLGTHFCLGASLARMETQESFAALLERFSRIELALPPGEKPRFVPFATIRQLRTLPLRFVS